MKQYCYVIMNNAGHSWAIRNGAEASEPRDPTPPVLPQLLQEGWAPVRETPMGGGTSQLAHSLILLQKEMTPPAAPRPARKGK
jgi:hypothetical protein